MGTPGADDGAWHEAAGRWFEEHCTDPGVCVVVAEVEGEVVATAMGQVVDRAPSPSSPSGGVVLVSNVSTLPERQGNGYASRALDELMCWVEGESCATSVSLSATGEGRGMYERLGFREHEYPEMRLHLT